MLDFSNSHLIEFLELYDLEENMLQDVLCISLIFCKLGSHAKNLAALPHVKLQVVIGACEPFEARQADTL